MLDRPDLGVLMELTANVVGEGDDSAWALVDEGFGSVVYEVRGWIVRVARNSEAQRGHELEHRLLPALAGWLAVPVPSSPLLIEPRHGLPHGAMVYRALPGRQMRPDDGKQRPELVAEVADALICLHAVPVSEAEKLGVLRPDPSAELAGVRETTERFLGSQLSPRSVAILTEWWDGTAEELLSFDPVLCHGDPWYGNLLVDWDDLHLAGLLDFEAAVISDPAVDLAATFHMGSSFGAAVLRRYMKRNETDQATIGTRVERHRLLRELAGLAFVLRHDWKDELPDAVSKVRALLPES